MGEKKDGRDSIWTNLQKHILWMTNAVFQGWILPFLKCFVLTAYLQPIVRMRSWVCGGYETTTNFYFKTFLPAFKKKAWN